MKKTNETKVDVFCKCCGFDKVRTSVFPVYCRCGAVIERDGSYTIGDRYVETLSNSGKCSHRGKELRREECTTCRGKKLIKVFACDKFGECQMIDKLPGVHVCDGGAQ